MNDAAASGDVWTSAWFTIWYSPRATIRRVVETDPRKFVIGIAWFAGALAALNTNVTTATSELPANLPHLPELGPTGMAVSAFVVGVLSIVALYGVAALYRWSGVILGGTASTVEVRAALAWSQVPGIYLTVTLIVVAVLGLYSPTIPPRASIFTLLEAVVGIWTIIISLKCLGEVHRFSGWRALGAILLGLLAMFAVVIGAVVTVWLAVVLARALV